MSVKKSGAFFSQWNELRQISLRRGQEASEDLLWLQRRLVKVCMREEGCPEISDLWSRPWNLKVRWFSCWINFKPPWMRSFLIPDVRNKGCSIPYPSGDYLEAVLSSLRKWMNPDFECCLGSPAVTLFASMNLIKAIVSDEVSTKTWCHIYKTFQKNLEESGGIFARINLKSRLNFNV